MNIRYYRQRFRAVLFRITHWNILGKSSILEKGFRVIVSKDSYLHIGDCFSTGGIVLLKVVGNSKLSIGSHCFFNNNTSITCHEGITIGENCKFGNNLVIVDHDHNYEKGQGFVSCPITIGNNVWIGANVVILRGTQIGDNCVIAAGSIVKDSIPSNTLYYQERTSKGKTIVR